MDAPYGSQNLPAHCGRQVELLGNAQAIVLSGKKVGFSSKPSCSRGLALSSLELSASALTRLRCSLPRQAMTDEPPESLIPYDEIVQEALRDVVGRVLHEVEQGGGLPGGHHFYITFLTKMPGVQIPKHLVERFPDEMTIVIQHRFWDLKVTKDGFSVGLSFGGVPSTLVVPFAAVTDFVDPAVDFSLKFQSNAASDVPEEHDEAENDVPVTQAEDGSNVVNVDFTKKK
jgi:hypothetical protein